jgi:YHS domain-containing protein
MMTRITYRLTWCLAAVALFATVAGCKKEEQPAKEEATKAATALEERVAPEKDVVAKVEGLTKEISTEMRADVEARLAKADAIDGAVDKVVSKCPACRLAMDGKSEHALDVVGYKLHFCSDACKQKFEKDPAKEILAMVIPKD